MCWHHHFYLNFKFLETAFKFRETAEPSKMERGKSVEFIWAAEVTLSWTWQNRTRLQCDQKGEKTVYEKCKMANKIFSYKRAFWGGTLKNTKAFFYFFLFLQNLVTLLSSTLSTHWVIGMAREVSVAAMES